MLGSFLPSALRVMGCSALVGRGDMSPLAVSQGHAVRPYLQHRTTTFLWYFASGHKVGNYRVCYWAKNLCEAYAVARAVIGDKASLHPEKSTPEVKPLSTWEDGVAEIVLCWRNCLEDERFPISRPTSPHLPLSCTHLPLFKSNNQANNRKHVCCEVCVLVKCLAINRKQLWPHLATYKSQF